MKKRQEPGEVAKLRHCQHHSTGTVLDFTTGAPTLDTHHYTLTLTSTTTWRVTGFSCISAPCLQEPKSQAGVPNWINPWSHFYKAVTPHPDRLHMHEWLGVSRQGSQVALSESLRGGEQEACDTGCTCMKLVKVHTCYSNNSPWGQGDWKCEHKDPVFL